MTDDEINAALDRADDRFEQAAAEADRFRALSTGLAERPGTIR